ncbi:LexA family protein [Pandoraea pnomenusa]|uniref:LexA family protein n=1 Tax=Pandoraea pnomenusa TaxID=93220 RepID=UPI003CED74B5
MRTFAERLQHAMDVRGVKMKKEIAKIAGVSSSAVTQWFKGDTKSLKADSILRVAKQLRVRVEWLKDGVGTMELATEFQNVEPAELGSRKVPVISYVQAGLMVEVVDPFTLGGGFEIIEVSVPCSPRTFALRIRGNSMEPRFYEGDLAIIDPELSPKPGQFVVAKNTSEEATFKKYRPRGLDERGNDVFELVPLNDDYPTLHSERDHLHIIGVCIERRENMLR